MKNSVLLKNIGLLVGVEDKPQAFKAGKDMRKLNVLSNAWVLVEGEKIAAYGQMNTCPETATQVVDAAGRIVMPAFCDSHSHIVYAGNRAVEYIDKIRGLSYEEIAKRGGGILNSVERLRKATEDELYEQALQRLNEMKTHGTGAVEIKSGYGLNAEAEIKMLRVIRRLKETSPLTIRSTFLGAHAVPAEYKGRQTEYVDYIINEMIPMVAAEDLADYIDVFCDRGFFTVEDTDRMLNAGMKYGLRPKVHANELDYSGGIQVAVKYNALSVDHLEYTGDEEIACLLKSETMPTLLPGAAFFLGMVYAPARKMIDAGLPLAMASDYNPGSCPSGNMQLVLSMGCIKYKLLPEEAINAVTHNSAYAMGVEDELGTITKGKRANLIVTTPLENIESLPYSFGVNKVETLILSGKIQ